MANIVMNIAKGRVKEYYARVEGNDPANLVPRSSVIHEDPNHV